MNKIKIGIIGYGNLGRGVELAIAQQPDMELVAIFTRRDPQTIVPQDPVVKVHQINEAQHFQDKIDVMILCGGSATDLPEQTPEFTQWFNTVDSFDNHAEIAQHLAKVNHVATNAEKVSVISTGWDPGLFSLNRVLFSSILSNPHFDTFWGKGVSQGHSDAIRRIEGVQDAKQYTIPVTSAIEHVRSGQSQPLTARQKHRRECYVVLKEGADEHLVREAIITMPNYFEPYETTVHFVTQRELDEKHSGLPHGGFVVASGQTGVNNQQVMEFKLDLDSNPEFTASVLTAYARAAYRLANEGQFGAKTVLDIPIALLSFASREELIQSLL